AAGRAGRQQRRPARVHPRAGARRGGGRGQRTVHGNPSAPGRGAQRRPQRVAAGQDGSAAGNIAGAGFDHQEERIPGRLDLMDRDGKLAWKKLHVSRWLPYAAAVLLLWAGGADACVTLPPIETPEILEVARTADIVAVIQVDRVDWRTPEEEAEFHRLWTHPPMETEFSYPTRSARFSVKQIFKGQVPANALIRSGSTDCE